MKKRIVLLFPGQGSQCVGMDNLPRSILGNTYVDHLWNQIDAKLGYHLSSIVTQGPLENLTLTQNTQPALVATSYMYYEALKTVLKDNTLDLVLGHSLGEYSALLCAKSFSLTDGVYITHLRGKYMQEAVPSGIGAMIAILKCPKHYVLEACLQCSTPTELVSIANDNSPEQVVISGHAVACQKTIDWLQQHVKERFRFIPLQVSAPFHSGLMQPALEKLSPYLNDLNIFANSVSYVSNVDAELNAIGTPVTNIKYKLLQQICGTVKWVECVQHLRSEDLIIEVGPGSVLTGLVKKIVSGSTPIYMDQEHSIELIQEQLKSS